MKNNLTEIAMIVDRSGSMSPFWDDVSNGFDGFIKNQKELQGECDFTLYVFDNEIDKIYDKVSIKDVNTIGSIYPRGMTALYDAIGTCINEVGNRLSNTPEDEKPSKVIVAIFTDGAENSSVEFNSSKIGDMIKHQEEKYSWEFLFLAAGYDAFQEAGHINMNLSRSVSAAASSDGYSASYNTLNTFTSLVRNSVDTSTINLQYEYDKEVTS